jgi:7-cyano-7-deazaguanine synthase in queuosine biosynthesis
MSILYLRTRPSEREPPSGILLDWFGRGGSSTVSGSLPELTRRLGTPDPLAVDLLRLAVATYGADKVVLRRAQRDKWTRPLRLHVPVADHAQWRAAAPAFIEALGFLTNDQWDLRFHRARREEAVASAMPLFGFDTVSLFSGGLDSLAAAIDLLEEGRRVVLVGHYDSNVLAPRQRGLFERLRDEYGVDRVDFRPFYLRPLGIKEAQARPLPRGREPTTRSRSFLFIAAAGVVASALGLTTVYVPENGFVGLNIPLEPTRVGACSTRTTHPHFLHLLAEALAAAGLDLAIENPYQLRTKGEVMEGCRNRELLLDLVPQSVSCAHPEVGRWSREGYSNCGYCYPCLLRRASLFRVGADNPSQYRIDVGADAFLAGRGRKTEHLRAISDSVRRQTRLSDVLRSGPLPRGRTGEFVSLYERGREEIDHWLGAAVPASG